jgi:DeoR family ulaG and ulaABCDEF operon transcriptional repressor
MDAAEVGPQGMIQRGVNLVSTERQLIDRAGPVILFGGGSRFASSRGAIVCKLDEVDVPIPDAEIGNEVSRIPEDRAIRLIVARSRPERRDSWHLTRRSDYRY